MPIQIKKQTNTSNIIKKIFIENLFGYYTYELNGNQNDKLLILYGDNGSGKTTVLKLVYYLLSTEIYKGHKSILANTRFKKINVTLSNGVVISAERENDQRGSFTYCIKSANGITIASSFLVALQSDETREFTIPATITNDEEKEYLRVIKKVNEIGISMYFLKDNRGLMTTIADKENDIPQNEIDSYILNHDDINKRHAGADDEEKISINEAFESFKDWIQIKVLKYSNVGETNNQNIYFELIKSIASSREYNEKNIKSKLHLEDLLYEISNLNSNLAKFDFVSDFDYNSLAQIVSKVSNDNKLILIGNVLMPFLEGSLAKINALTGIYNTVTNFINNINDYFHDKTILYNLHTGFFIRHYSGDSVAFNDLSSGEQHLLHLWINAITAEDATIFIIDEPEISLNIKWQRKLLDSLLSYAENRKIQFIIATHSIELITDNYNSVVKLENIKINKAYNTNN